MRSVEEYKQALVQLLPRGELWTSLTRPGSNFDKLLDAMAAELRRTEGRGQDLLDEADPRVTLEMLTDWEAMAGLPDDCVSDPGTTQERRNALVARLTQQAGLSEQDFIDLAADLGFTVTITNYTPFTAGSDTGDRLTNGDWVFTWQVNAPSETETYFRSGEGSAGEPLSEWGNESLECGIDRAKPAHTIVNYAYGS